jgi:hypothetical protein
MVKTTITWKRETTETPWWTTVITNTYKDYVKSKYGVVGKRLSSKLTMSKDGLILTSETVFANEAAFEEFSSDPIIRTWVNSRKEYCTKNNIQESSRITQVY